MLAISKIDMIIWELEGACEVEHSVSQESIDALVGSCGRAHTEITRLQKALTEISDTLPKHGISWRAERNKLKRIAIDVLKLFYVPSDEVEK